MAMQNFGFLCGFLVVAASAYYSADPVVHTRNPLIHGPSKPIGCHPPFFKYGSYSPALPSGVCPYGTILHFQCKQGYRLNGPEHAKCTASGHWSPPHIPTCNKIDRCKFQNPCGHNAHCIESRGQLKCLCEKGYYPKGNKCITKVCSVPVLNAYCQYSPRLQHQWLPGQKIKFVCPPGYDLEGAQYAECLHGGKWDQASPICKKRVYCNVPSLPHYCSYTPHYQRTWDYGQKIQFHCPKGFKMVGNAYASCMHGGKWDSYPPKCEGRVVCHKPTLTPHCGYQPRYQTTWHPEQKVKFYCAYGYQLTGHPYAKCGYDGRWSNPAPVCKKIQVYCKAPPLPYTCHCHLSTHYKQYYAVGEMAKFSCPHGLKLNGFAVAKCMYNGHWSHPTPVCIKPTPFRFGLGFLTKLG